MKEEPISAEGHSYKVICITDKVCYIDRENTTYIAIVKESTGCSVMVDNGNSSRFSKVAEFITPYESVIDDVKKIRMIIKAVTR